MDTSQQDRQDAGEERPTTATEDKRDQHQREQVEAQAAGDTGGEIKAMLKETLNDQVQFVDDIAKDAKDPDRRLNEEQGTTTQPGAEPAEGP